MFQRDLAKITADHLRTHIEAYLNGVNAAYSEPITLVVPQHVEPASMAGGVFAAPQDQLPFYGVDCITKQYAQRPENLFCYEYTGHIAGLVTAGSRADVDAIVKAHSAATELFVKDHKYLHQTTPGSLSTRFTLLEFGFISGTFSGAEPQVIADDHEVWIAGFEVDTFWQTSEDSSDQH